MERTIPKLLEGAPFAFRVSAVPNTDSAIQFKLYATASLREINPTQVQSSRKLTTTFFNP